MTHHHPKLEAEAKKHQKPNKKHSSHTVANVFHKKSIGDIAKWQSRGVVYSINADDTLHHALWYLTKHNVHSCPLIDLKKNKIVGFFDYLDIVSFTCATDEEVDNDTFLGELEKRLTSTKVHEVSDFSDRDPLLLLFETTDATKAVKYLFGKDIQHTAVVDKKGAVQGIISQWSFVRYLRDHISLVVEEKRGATLGELDIGVDPIFCYEEDIVIDVLKILNKNRISGLPVCNHKGEIVGNFSASDFKHIAYVAYDATHDKYDKTSYKGWDTLVDDLYKPVGEFVEAVFEVNKKDTKDTGFDQVHSKFVTAETTYEDLVKLVVESHIHRVYMIDDEKHAKPIKVISLVDIIRAAQPDDFFKDSTLDELLELMDGMYLLDSE